MINFPCFKWTLQSVPTPESLWLGEWIYFQETNLRFAGLLCFHRSPVCPFTALVSFMLVLYS